MINVEALAEVLKNGISTGIFLNPVSDPEITMSTSAKIKTSFSGAFLPNDQVDFLTDTIKLYLVLDGQKLPVGEFIVTTKLVSFVNGFQSMKLDGYDKCYLAETRLVEDEIFFPADTPYLTAIKSLLHDCGVGWVISDDCPHSLISDRCEWEIGTSYLDIINDLLAEINFESLFFNSAGFAVLKQKNIPSPKNISHIYNSGELSLIRSDIAVSNDNFKKFNVFIALSSTPEREPLKAISVNDSLTSPVSTVNLGRRIVAPVYRLDSVPNLQILQDYIDNIRFAETQTGEYIEFETALSAKHGVGDIIAINHEHINGIFYETDWSMSLGVSGIMKHTAKRVVFL